MAMTTKYTDQVTLQILTGVQVELNKLIACDHPQALKFHDDAFRLGAKTASAAKALRRAIHAASPETKGK